MSRDSFDKHCVSVVFILFTVLLFAGEGVGGAVVSFTALVLSPSHQVTVTDSNVFQIWVKKQIK